MKLYRHVTANNIHLQEFPFQRELSMEAYLVENPEVLRLDDDELSDVSIVDVELPIVAGRSSKNSDGRVDLIAQYGEDTVAVIELKLGVLNEHHLNQLEDYLNEVNQIGEIVRTQLDIESPKYLGILVGSDIEASLSDRISNGDMVAGGIAVAALTIRRFRGEDNNIYVMTDVFFKNASRDFDRTKYLFNGTTYGKGRLVLAVVKKYVEDNPDVTYAELERVFPRKLEGSWGVFDTVEKAMEIFNRSKRKRHFLAPEEIIQLGDEKIAVCTQWGTRNIGNISKKAKELEYEIRENK